MAWHRLQREKAADIDPLYESDDDTGDVSPTPWTAEEMRKLCTITWTSAETVQLLFIAGPRIDIFEFASLDFRHQVVQYRSDWTARALNLNIQQVSAGSPLSIASSG